MISLLNVAFRKQPPNPINLSVLLLRGKPNLLFEISGERVLSIQGLRYKSLHNSLFPSSVFCHFGQSKLFIKRGVCACV